LKEPVKIDVVGDDDLRVHEVVQAPEPRARALAA
jgi:hypothetical protein